MRFLLANFDTRHDLLLKRKLILVTSLQTMVLIIFSFFAVFNFTVTLDFVVGSFDAIGVVLTIIAIYLLRIKRRIDLSIYMVVVILFIFLNALAAANQNVSYGIIWTFFYPIFVILLLGHKRGLLPIVLFYMVLLTQAFIGIGTWQNGVWDMASFVRLTFASVVVTYSAYFNEWSLDQSYSELQRVRQRESDAAKEYSDDMLKMLENKKQLLVDVSHELRTPLSVIKVYLEAMEDGINNEAESYPVLQRKVNQIDRLIQDIYLISKSDINQLNIEKKPIYISELLAELELSFQTLAQNKNLTLDFQNSLDDNCIIFGDWERLIQVYSNLLQNSLSYTDSGGLIRLKTISMNDGIQISIADSSPGVSVSEQQQLFERLYRQESSRNRATGGSGLGLAICKALIEIHGGNISIASSSLGGLELSTWLPLNEKKT